MVFFFFQFSWGNFNPEGKGLRVFSSLFHFFFFPFFLFKKIAYLNLMRCVYQQAYDTQDTIMCFLASFFFFFQKQI